MMDSDRIVTLNIRELLEANDRYSIPIYQRNYAWEEKEITQLIQDVIDFVTGYKERQKSYYLGTLIVDEKLEQNRYVYETIDGQQRLTTLNIIAAVLRNEFDVSLDWFQQMNLEFESRKLSTNTLDSVYHGNFRERQAYNEAIKNAYELCTRVLRVKLNEHSISADEISDHLFRDIKILRVPVPEDTELNHYFEIMNNRGEQLEKHEILKARLLKVFNRLPDAEKRMNTAAFNCIWEACANMEKYVQYGFTVEQRHLVFGKNNWNDLQPDDFNELVELLFTAESAAGQSIAYSIEDILSGNTSVNDNIESEENPDRFNSVINFQNFLLQVLRASTREDIPLDDKRLIDTFQDFLDNEKDQVEFVKDFAYNLLKSKFYFDKYVIKREFIGGSDKWSLKRLKWYKDNKVSYVNTFGAEDGNEYNSENRTALMLLSMFHVSTPTMVYKHWLNAVMYFFFLDENIVASEYIEELEAIAKDFVFGRFINREPRDYFDMIYGEREESYSWSDVDESKLIFGNITNNLIFNYIDYLLWYEEKDDPVILKYEFSFRSSVEHYYPQYPLSGFERLDEVSLNSFGNLCLISHSKNSRLSNFMPAAKKNYYAENNIDSIKQYKMMQYNPEQWGKALIEHHHEEMIDLLKIQID